MDSVGLLGYPDAIRNTAILAMQDLMADTVLLVNGDRKERRVISVEMECQVFRDNRE